MAGPGGGGGDMDGFQADNDSCGGNVTDRLKKLMVARHEVTLKAMLDELEDHQVLSKQRVASGSARPPKQQQEEKKQEHEDNNDSHSLNGNDEDLETTQRYAQLQIELELQHRKSLSTLNSLTPYEMSIAQGSVIDPSNLAVTFADVGGMDDIKSEIYDLVVVPLLRPDLFMNDSGLVSPPKGILLYGPPGTGKTMLAKAIAKESHATFLNVQLSTIMNKWFGESNKLISATFHLARKLAPSVVFIDEMDAFLSQRDGTEGSAVNSMKSEFLTLWDGLLSERKSNSFISENNAEIEGGASNGWRFSFSGNNDTAVASVIKNATPLLPTPPVIVLGATNRPYDVDPAILRRLPRSFEVPLPALESRLQLLELFLEKQNMTKSAKEFVSTVAKRTEGYSGSDLKEVCRAAAWEPVRELTAGASRQAVGCGGGGAGTPPTLKQSSNGFPPRGTKARPVNENDFLLALQKVKKTGDSARQFHTKEFLRGREEKASMAAEISRATTSKGKKAKIKKEEVNAKNSCGEKPSKAKLDTIQQVIAMAMAAAASIENGDKSETRIDDIGFQECFDEQCDDDVPPEMSEEETE